MPESILDGFRCTGCGLSAFSCKRVPGRGVWPAEVLFIGEAPGKTEDVLGEAFIGPSGKLLDRAFRDAVSMGGYSIPTYYITNVLACRPTDRLDGPNREPTKEEVERCKGRLLLTVSRVQAKVVVLLGGIAQKSCKKMFPDTIALVHPLFILRKGGVTSSVYRAFVRGLTVVFQKAAEERAKVR